MGLGLSGSLLQGDCRNVLREFDDEHYDACVTDPPYELGFMGKSWDRSGVAFDPETWAAVHRVLKPGAHLLAFGGTRTVHRIAVAIEDAGFEIRDQIAWMFGQGFPKSRNLGNGWGTALKPAYEPIIVARKPLRGTVVQNVTTYGTGAINVDGCRIEGEPSRDFAGGGTAHMHGGKYGNGADRSTGRTQDSVKIGRWPANVALDEAAAAELDRQSGRLSSGANPTRRGSNKFNATYGEFAGQRDCTPARGADTGGASRFFYCAKASRAERNAGLDGLPQKMLRWSAGDQNPGSFQSDGTNRFAQNHHPTVKPIALMRWLVRLVTPPGGHVLDPFMGSGSTGIACALEGFGFTGIEKDPEYLEIARLRIDATVVRPTLFEVTA